MMYSGANAMFGTAGFPAYAIGAAFSRRRQDVHARLGERLAARAGGPGAHRQRCVLQHDGRRGGSGGRVRERQVPPVVLELRVRGRVYCRPSAYGIAHATSTDGIYWQVAEAPVRSLLQMAAVPTSGGGQPSVIYDAGHCRWEMWLTRDATGEADNQPIVFNNMAGVWHATSSDGVTWSLDYSGHARPGVEWRATPDDGEHLGLLTGADVAVKERRTLHDVRRIRRPERAQRVLPARSVATRLRAWCHDVGSRDPRRALI